MDFVDIYTQQISRWRTETPSPSQVRELHRMETQNQQLRAVTADCRATIKTGQPDNQDGTVVTPLAS